MYANDQEVLQRALEWSRAGHRVALITVLSTFGGSPRPPGSMAAIRQDGAVVGSVSGGCVEDDLVDEIRRRPTWNTQPAVAVRTFGATDDEFTRYRLPCGNTLRVAIENTWDRDVASEALHAIQSQTCVVRNIDLVSGRTWLSGSPETVSFGETSESFFHLLGPRYRALVIGATELGRYLVNILPSLGFSITVCDPRMEYVVDWDLDHVRLTTNMPDDEVVAMRCDRRSAVLAVSHDPKLDDLALLEALKSSAFYVGALGSSTTTAKRKDRLRLFDLRDDAIDRLRGPIGLDIGSRTPAEIAVSIAAEMIAARRAMERGETEGSLSLAHEAQAS